MHGYMDLSHWTLNQLEKLVILNENLIAIFYKKNKWFDTIFIFTTFIPTPKLSYKIKN